MANLVINGTTFLPITEGFPDGLTLSEGNYYATGNYAPTPTAGYRKYEQMQVTFPDVDGISVIYGGARECGIECTLLFGGTPSEAMSNLEDFQEMIEDPSLRYTISIPYGSSINGCKVSQQGPIIQDPMGQGKIVLVCKYQFLSMSLTN
jgi:hypothetical protein